MIKEKPFDEYIINVFMTLQVKTIVKIWLVYVPSLWTIFKIFSFFARKQFSQVSQGVMIGIYPM